MVRHLDVQRPELRLEPAQRQDFRRIAQLLVDVYVGGGLASPDYATKLADVAGRADRAELLVAREEGGGVVGSVALVLRGDFGNVIACADEAAFRMLVVDPAAQGQGIGSSWYSSAWSAPARRGSAGWCSRPIPG